jgi:hypothetical protein
MVAWNIPIASGTYTRIEGVEELSIFYATIRNLVLRMEDMETKRSELWGIGQINKIKI